MTVDALRGARDPAPRTLPGRGNYWVNPMVVAIGFTAFVVYSSWSVIAAGGHHWQAGPYLSPYYSPYLRFTWFPFSSAFLVAWSPLAFRATCYYYRKAYYRAFFWDPQACAIREPAARKSYNGERGFPWILNNFHRFFLYVAVLVLGVLWYDTVNAFIFHGAFYIGAGSILMLINVCLLTLYTFSCHALRHLVGGNINCYSCTLAGGTRRGMWRVVSAINPQHGSWAWASLISVAAVDIYIHIVSVYPSCFGVHTGC